MSVEFGTKLFTATDYVIIYRDATAEKKLGNTLDNWIKVEYPEKFESAVAKMAKATEVLSSLPLDAKILVTYANQSDTEFYLVTDEKKMLEWGNENIWGFDKATNTPGEDIVAGEPGPDVLLKRGDYAADENGAFYGTVAEVLECLKVTV